MGNNIELITKYSPKYWDLTYKQESVLSLLDAPKDMIKFEGARTVKIAKFQSGGLSNYYRNNNAGGYGDTRIPTPAGGEQFVGASDFGYQKSNLRLTWEEFQIRCDRAAAFEIETFDNEESGEQLVGLGVTEISRTVIVPETDAYGLSTIASYVLPGATETEDITTTPLASLNKGFLYFANHEIQKKNLIVYCSPDFMNALRNTNEVTKFLGQPDLGKDKNITFEITKYMDAMLVETSPDRLRTNVELYDGGYKWGTGSQAINFLMVNKEAVYHVVKYENVKIISGEINLAARGFDGYTVFARVYHDVFVPDNKRVGLYMSVVQTAVAAPALTLDVLVKDGKVKSLTTNPGEKLCFVVTGGKGSEGTTEANVGDTLTKADIVRVGDAIAATTIFYAIDSNKKVLAKFTYTV